MKLWYKWYKVYLILLCLESLVLKHHRLNYPCRFIWQENFWTHLLPIGTNLQVFRLFSYKVLAGFIYLGKQGKLGKQKQPPKKKNMRCNRGKFYFFASCLLRSVEVPVLIKLRYTVHHCGIPRLLVFFLQQEIFYKSP